jgi:hypothetical protein
MAVTLDHDTLLPVLKSLLFTPAADGWGLPFLLVGEPGTAKSAALDALVRSCGLTGGALTLIGSTCDPTEFGGVPSPDPDRPGFVRALYPEWAGRVQAWDGEGGAVLLDEITSVPGTTQAAMLGLVLNRRVGGLRFGPRVRFLAACNPPAIAVSGQDLAAPMANRFAHFTWEGPGVDTLAGVWGMDDHERATAIAPIDAAALEARVLAEWPEQAARAQTEVLGYLRRAPVAHRQCCPDPSSPAASGPWPSSRTWEYAWRAVAGARIHGLADDALHAVVAACVGDAAAVGFFSWLRQHDLPSPVAVLDQQVTWGVQPGRPDRTQVVFDGLAATLKATKDQGLLARRAVVYWVKVAEAVAAGCPDLAHRATLQVSLLSAVVNTLPEAVGPRRAMAGYQGQLR